MRGGFLESLASLVRTLSKCIAIRQTNRHSSLYIYRLVRRVAHHILAVLRLRTLSSALCYDCGYTLKLFIEKRFDSSHMKLMDDTKFLSTMLMAIDRFHVKNHKRMTCKTFMRPDHEIHNNIYSSIRVHRLQRRCSHIFPNLSMALESIIIRNRRFFLFSFSFEKRCDCWYELT